MGTEHWDTKEDLNTAYIYTQCSGALHMIHVREHHGHDPISPGTEVPVLPTR